MERIKKSELVSMFGCLCNTMNKTSGHEKGNWCLDYAPIYGGYVIEEIEESGGISHPFGSGRRSASEMYWAMNMAVMAVYELRHQQRTINKNKVV